jgi:flagellar motor switch protein FliN/FliY
MSEEANAAPGESAEDAMAAEWAAALAESAPAGGGDDGAMNAGVQTAVDSVAPAKFTNFSNDASLPAGNDINMILDIPVTITVELGRTKIQIRNLLQLAQGSVIELDGMAGEPMTVLVNGCLIAQGEVVVVNEKFGIRLTDIITPEERLRRLNR